MLFLPNWEHNICSRELTRHTLDVAIWWWLRRSLLTNGVGGVRLGPRTCGRSKVLKCTLFPSPLRGYFTVSVILLASYYTSICSPLPFLFLTLSLFVRSLLLFVSPLPLFVPSTNTHGNRKLICPLTVFIAYICSLEHVNCLLFHWFLLPVASI